MNDNLINTGPPRANGRGTASVASVLTLLSSLPLSRCRKSGSLVHIKGARVLPVGSSEFEVFVLRLFEQQSRTPCPMNTLSEAIKAAQSMPWQETDREPGSKPRDTDDKSTDAETLVRMAKEKCFFFHDNGKAYAYVHATHDANRVRSDAFRGWLQHEYFVAHGRVPRTNALGEALATLDAIGCYSKREEKVAVRVARDGEGVFWIDLANEGREVLRIDAEGWRILKECPVKFVRHPGMRALPTPQRGGSIDELRAFVNVSAEDDFVLLVSFLAFVLTSQLAYPILAVSGEQGSAKSTLLRVVRALTDPNQLAIRSPPRDERDLVVSAGRSHVLAYDNLSGLTADLADAFCRVATGAGYAIRANYTDDEEAIFNHVRPIICSGIPQIAVRPDLADRTVSLSLKPIARQDRKEEIWPAFDAAAPRILGALLDGIVGAFVRKAEIHLAGLPRMASFALFATAAELALGFTEGAVAKALSGNRDEAITAQLEGDPVASTLLKLAQRRHGAPFEGRMTELLEVMHSTADEHVRRAKGWPKLPQQLSASLARVTPVLRHVGVNVEMGRTASARHVRIDFQTFNREQASSSSSSPSSRPEILERGQ